MKYHAQQLPNGRWGIYKELQLLASVGCERTCQELVSCLISPKTKKPQRIDLLRKSSQITDTLARPILEKAS